MIDSPRFPSEVTLSNEPWIAHRAIVAWGDNVALEQPFYDPHDYGKTQDELLTELQHRAFVGGWNCVLGVDIYAHVDPLRIEIVGRFARVGEWS